MPSQGTRFLRAEESAHGGLTPAWLRCAWGRFWETGTGLNPEPVVPACSSRVQTRPRTRAQHDGRVESGLCPPPPGRTLRSQHLPPTEPLLAPGCPSQAAADAQDRLCPERDPEADLEKRHRSPWLSRGQAGLPPTQGEPSAVLRLSTALDLFLPRLPPSPLPTPTPPSFSLPSSVFFVL